MKSLTGQERLTIIEFFFKRKSLYRLVGWLFALSLLSSLALITIPKELTPNYADIAKEYGLAIAYVTAYILGKYFGTEALIIIVTKVIVMWMCFYFEAKLKAAGKHGLTIKNLIIGIGNNVSNTIK